ncbi:MULTISPECIES: DUF1430 domain-containing protein [unclassified Virgibacillus]|uniref:DUF1430 domain-containing protein n=1 Tax=unclassified Virgibacillus TaxID=2620237 RepID=UPI00090C4507|nr:MULTISPECIES: DUF1430 domain-containing protein [unclassified Virgibacillus]API92866.1 hypothetical protein BKP57_14250 [Virgibacillus sp. 6R]MBS7428378.1 DUF1430 domain-containing protein [Virgibacillus sp. 19R1-5]
MKKVWIAFLTVGLILINIAILLTYQQKEVATYFKSNENNFNITIGDWSKSVPPKQLLTELDTFAKENQFNIYKKVMYGGETTQQNLKIYASIHNKELFHKEFNIPNQIQLNRKVSLGSDKEIALFNKNFTINLYPIEEANEENIRGFYTFQMNNPKDINLIKNKLTDLGFNYSLVKMTNFLDMIVSNPSYIALTILLSVYILLFLLVTLYEIFMRYNEIAVYKLHGYRSANIVQTLLLEKLRQFFLITAILGIIGIIAIYFYNDFKGLQGFFLYWLVVYSIFSVMLIIIYLCSLFVIREVNIPAMIKHKRPLKRITILNMASKVFYAIIVTTLLFNLLETYDQLKQKLGVLDEWDVLKNYSILDYLEHSSDDPNKRQQIETELGEKSRELFRLLNHDSLVIEPSQGYIDNNAQPNSLDPYEGNGMVVNETYVKRFIKPINKPIPTTNGTTLQLYVPEKYKDSEDEIKKIYLDWFRGQKYMDALVAGELTETEYNQKKLDIHITYIASDKKYFLFNYGDSYQVDYAVDPVFAMITADTLGPSAYLSIMSSRLFVRTDNPNKPYTELLPKIKKSKLESSILATPNVYTEVAYEISSVKTAFIVNIIMLISIFIVSIIILAFITVNYLERNKLFIAVKTIHGYTTWDKHKKFFLFNFLSWFAILSTFALLSEKVSMLFFVIIMAFICIELALIRMLIRVYENKNTVLIVKGE